MDIFVPQSLGNFFPEGAEPNQFIQHDAGEEVAGRQVLRWLADRLVGVNPTKQPTLHLRTPVGVADQVNGHRCVFGDAFVGTDDHLLSADRLNGNFDAGHLADHSREGAGCVNYGAGGDGAPRGLHPADTLAI